MPWKRSQTYASPVSANEVLVVYNSALGVSDSVKNYYVSKRGIPANNVIALNIPDGTSKYGATYNARTGQITGPTTNSSTWQFYRNLIEVPLMTELNKRGIKNKIRFIVLVRGIPQTLNTSGTYNNQYHYNASVDGLLCLLYQDVMKIYGTSYRTQFNPYYGVDLSKTLDYHFKSRHFGNGVFGLTYLVSRLDGGQYPNNYQTIKEAIDRGVNTDMTGTGGFVLDDKNNQNLYLDLKGAKDSLTAHGFRTAYNNTASHTTSDMGKVMGYSSHGVHAGLAQDYLINTLKFNYANGAVFNTAESFNGWTLNKREAKSQGLLADFITRGGTGGIAHVQEPFAGSIARTSIFFDMYAAGYSLVEAAYMSIPYLAWVHVVIGDPFTVIGQGKETIAQNKVWDKDMFVTGNVTVAANASLRIRSGQQITFMQGARLIVQNGGTVVLEPGAMLSTSVNGVKVNKQIDFVSGTPVESGKLSFSQMQSGTNVSVRMIANQPAEFKCCNKIVNRHYSIQTDAASFKATLVLPYNQNELTNPKIKENKLEAFRYDGTAWTKVDGVVDTVNNVITLSNVTSAGLWAIADTSLDAPVTLKSFASDISGVGIKLTWTTQTATGNAGFIILRDGVEVSRNPSSSGVAIASYQYAASTKGQGTGSAETAYSFVDKTAVEGRTYTYSLRSIDNSGQTHDYTESVTVRVPDTKSTGNGINEKPISYGLGQNYPNPFNPSTMISYSISKTGAVNLTVYDLLGRKVATLVNEQKNAGAYEIRFDGSSLASGTYFYRLQCSDFVETKQMVLVK